MFLGNVLYHLLKHRYVVFSHEGRSWYSAHRGILWIAATAKTPQSSEITAVEDGYRKCCSGLFPLTV